MARRQIQPPGAVFRVHPPAGAANFVEIRGLHGGYGGLMPDGVVSVSLTIDERVDDVWRAITVGRSSWWPEMVFEPIAGSALVETWIEDGEEKRATGTITGAVAPSLLSFEWSEPGWVGPLSVSICLEPLGAATKVTLTESGFTEAQSPSGLPAEHQDGWLYHLTRLQKRPRAAR